MLKTSKMTVDKPKSDISPLGAFLPFHFKKIII